MEFEFNNLVRDIVAAGNYATEQQSKISRGIKEDGSILTKTDTDLDKLITGKIKDYYSGNRVDYRALSDRSKAPEHFVSGTEETHPLIHEYFKLKQN